MAAPLDGKLALVTGASKGIGQAIAEQLAARGATVIAAARSLEGRVLADRRVPGVIPVTLDVCSESAVDALFAEVQSKLGPLDVLVNNAGVGVFKPTIELSLDEWNQVIGTNLTGAFLCARAAFRQMKAAGGRIIHIGSIADHVNLSGCAAYGASKFGLRGLSGVINEDGKEHGVRSTLISVGASYTHIWEGREEFDASDMLSPADVADTVADVASKGLGIRIDELRILPPQGVL